MDTNTMNRTWYRRLLHGLDRWTLYAFNSNFPTHPHRGRFHRSPINQER